MKISVLCALAIAMLSRTQAWRSTSRIISKSATRRLFSTAGIGEPINARINQKVDLSSEKVVNTISLKPGEKYVVCRCWQSSKFPACDGAHAAHNKRTGDNLGPCIITVPKADA
ncbi:CDGSH iron-sulfur domain-containing protein [archaeon]|nr:MAG: CDGSH iron-sulfur domain-containing protein [archaeon]